jgi:squalene-associated FAD-dependent desaturase
MRSGRRVVVVGGGLAGITAALDCAAAGAEVTLVEVRRRLGGAAYSFEREGLRMDNGQHVFLRCCFAYRALLRRIGSEQLVRVQPRLEIPVLRPGAAPAMLRRGRLPAPLHLAGTLARYGHLGRAERLRAARAAFALTRERMRPQAVEEPTFGEWLAAHGQGERAVDALWDLIALPTLNVPAAQASLSLSLFVFHTGLLSSADAGDIGFHEATLSEIIAEPSERALREAGVELLLGRRAQALSTAGAPAAVRISGAGERPEEELAANAVVLALPHTRAAALLAPLRGELAARIARIGHSPIVNLHLLYDREVFDGAFAAGVQTPVQYLFDRTRAAGAPPGSQYLAVSLSGAEREMKMSVPELRARYEPALRELLPRARAAKLELFLATREHAATFRAAPGVQALRPHAESALPGIVLAGAWTATGWPATLESAVISGHEAARSVVRGLGITPAAGEPASAQSAPAQRTHALSGAAGERG